MQISTKSGSITKLAILALFLISIPACSKKNNDAQVKPTQVIARVNDYEITVHQLNNELQRMRVQPAQQQEMAKQVVSGLIDRQILIQEAIKEKLDSNAGVIQAIESYKAQVYAQAYMESKLNKIAKPTDLEIADYKKKNQQILSKRKIFIMDEMFLPLEANNQELKDISNNSKTLDEIQLWLDQKKVQYTRTHAARTSETLNPGLLDQLSKMRIGDIIFVITKDNIMISSIEEVKDAPIPEAMANNIIANILMVEKRKAATESLTKDLRKSAEIVYLDKKFELSNRGVSSQNATPPATSDAEKKLEKPKSNALEKGISGL